jgi:hypothetical protein
MVAVQLPPYQFQTRWKVLACTWVPFYDQQPEKGGLSETSVWFRNVAWRQMVKRGI